MQILKFFGMVLLTIVFCVNFTACSEDEESENTEISGLKEILVGVWVQDGDDDIFVFNADGTGFVYANEESYLDNSYYTLLSWTNNTGVSSAVYKVPCTITAYDDPGNTVFEETLYGVWPQEVADISYDGSGSDYVKPEVTFAFDYKDE